MSISPQLDMEWGLYQLSQLPGYQFHMDAAAGEPLLGRNCQKHYLSWLVCELEVMLWDLVDTLGTDVISRLILLIKHLQ